MSEPPALGEAAWAQGLSRSLSGTILGTEESRAHPKLNDDHCHAWAASSGHGMLIGSLLRVCHMGEWCPHHGVQRILKLGEKAPLRPASVL